MKIYIFTQEDVLYLPKFFDKFLDELPDSITIHGVSILKGEISPQNYSKYFYFLRLKGCFKYLFLFFKIKIFSFFINENNNISSSSVRESFKRRNIYIRGNENINSEEFLKVVEIDKIDLFVSVACPKLIKNKLRESVKYGAINIHGALLPKYRGMLPSFWVLNNNEIETGVTVHVVNNKIDDGPIILQESIKILNGDSVHSLLLRSKIDIGPNLLTKSILLLKSGLDSFISNETCQSSYYSFPSKQVIKDFYKNGNKII